MEWISVNNRFPPDDEVVLCKQIYCDNLMLCCISDGHWYEAYEELVVRGDAVIESRFCEAGNPNDAYLRITHWMPLPPPPKS